MMLDNAGMIGVRAPMHETELPVVRPYLLIEDISQAVDEKVVFAQASTVSPKHLDKKKTQRWLDIWFSDVVIKQI